MARRSTSVRAGPETATFIDPRHSVFTPNRRLARMFCRTKTAPCAVTRFLTGAAVCEDYGFVNHIKLAINMNFMRNYIAMTFLRAGYTRAATAMQLERQPDNWR
jgi:hypothetical protein